MTIFRATFDLIRGKFSRTHISENIQREPTGSARASGAQHLDVVDAGGATGGATGKNTRRYTRLLTSTKRKALDTLDSNVTKRFKPSPDAADSGYGDTPINRGNIGDIALSAKQTEDRHRMPPPATPVDRTRSRSTRPRSSLDSVDLVSEARSQRTKRAEVSDDYDMEAARRRAAATELPPNSGIWEPAEKELFFHLSYRGFEPLFSKGWMHDFPTLPLSLFAVEDDQIPLVHFNNSSEFRAIRALRELMDTGKVVRDRALSSNNELRSEPIILKAVKKYIRWAFKDLRVPTKECVQVHTSVTMKAGRSTQETIRELTLKMHRLSTQHRRDCNVHSSIEQTQEGQEGSNDSPTRVSSEDAEFDQVLPTIYGFMVYSSILAVFTLSSHTPPPRFVQQALDPTIPNLDAGDGDNEESGLRLIAHFDFSEGASDVWNAIAVAITAMMIRNTMRDVYDFPTTSSDGAPDYEESVLDSSLLGADDETMSEAVYTTGRRRKVAVVAARDSDPDL